MVQTTYDPIKYATPTGTQLNCKGWIQEAALRMLLNNLNPEVAERPDDLIVYGGRGKAARNFESLDLIIKALKDLEEDGAQDDPEDGAFAAAEGASTKDGSGDAVEFVKVAEGGCLHGGEEEDQQDATDTREEHTEDVSGGYDAFGVEAGVAGGLFVASNGIEVTSED